MKSSKEERFYLLGFLLVTLIKGTNGQCYVEDPLLGEFTQVIETSSNETMAVEICKKTCVRTGYAFAGLSEVSFCLCSNAALTPGAAGCGDTCLADGNPCGLITEGNQMDLYDTGGGPPDFTLTATLDTATGLVTATIVFTSSSEEFHFNFGDTTPIVIGEPTTTAPAVPPTTQSEFNFFVTRIPGEYNLTVIGKIPGTSLSFSASSALPPIDAIPSIDLIECPVIQEPDIAYLCNSSVTYTNPSHSYTASFDDFPAVTTTMIGIGNTFKQIGISVPKGPSEEVSSTSSAPTDIIDFLQNPIVTKSHLIALDYYTNVIDPVVFEALTPVCPAGLIYCVYLKSCLVTCPYDYETMAFTCPATFCSSQNTCGDAGTCTAPGVPPASWTPVLIYSDPGGPPDHTRRHYDIPQPFEVLPGTVIRATGSLARWNDENTLGDTVNGVQTNFHHYLSVTVKELILIPIEHTCLEILKDVTLSIVDDVDTTNLYTGPPAVTICERNITDFTMNLTQTDTDLYDPSLNMENPYYVRTGFPFDLNMIFSVAGPIWFDLTFIPPNTPEATVEVNLDFPLPGGPYTHPVSRTIAAEGVYSLSVDAYNQHNTLPDEVTGIAPGPLTDEILIHALHMVSPDWTVSPVGDLTGAFLVPRDVPTFIFIDTAAIPFPTNATVSIDWGDETPFEVVPFEDPGDQQPVFTHSYTVGAVYTITANITNIVSGTFNITTVITIYEQVFNFAITNMYFPSDTAITGRPGFGRFRNQYPMDKNLSFFPTMTQGTVESYRLEFTSNNSVIETYVVANMFEPTIEHFNYHFDFETFLNLTVYAINKFESVPVYLFVEIVGMIRGLQIDDFSYVTEGNELKTFEITCESVGGGTCIIISYGDGFYQAFGEEPTCLDGFSHVPFDPTVTLDIAFNVTHTYTEEGMYNATVYGYNEVSEASDMIYFPVTNLKCRPPIVTMADQVLDYLSGPPKLRGKEAFFLATGTVDCELTLKTKKRWQLYHIDEESGQQLLAVVPVMHIIPTWNKPEFVIPANFLNYSYYMALFTITMYDESVPILHEFVFQKQEITYFYIDKSPIVVKLTASSITRVARGLEQSILLEPAVHSIDPDFPDIKNYTVKWRCRRVSETYDDPIPELDIAPIVPGGTGCFGYGPGFMNFPAREMEIYGNQFVAVDETYEIEALLTKDTRTGRATIHIHVTSLDVPTVEVKCMSTVLCTPAEDGKGVYVNPNFRMGLMATCVLACDEILTYKWKVLDDNDNVIPVPADFTPIGDDGNEFSLIPDFFKANPALQDFKIEVEVENMATPPTKGFSTYFMKVNQPPKGGICELDKYNGKVMIDKFFLTCRDWIDPEKKGVEFYIVRLLTPDDPPATLIEHRHTSLPEQIVPLVLPFGVYTIEISISDVWGAITDITLPQQVTVTMISKEEFDEFDSQLVMDKLVGGGNAAMITMMANARNSIVMEADYFDVNNPDLSPEEREQLMVDINKIHEQTIKALDESLTFMTSGSNEAGLNILSQMMLGVSDTPNDALTFDLFTREDTVDLLEDMVGNILEKDYGDPESLRNMIQSLATIAAGLVLSMMEITSCKSGSRIPPLDVRNGDLFYYDSDIGYDIEMTLIPTKEEAIPINVRGHSLEKSESQLERIERLLQGLDQKCLGLQLTGEVLDVQTKNNMSVVNKMLKGLPGKHDAMLCYVIFPDGLCPQGNCSDPVGLELKEWPTINYLNTESAEALTGGSRVLDITIYDREVNILDVDDSPEDIIISIYRTVQKRGYKILNDPERVNATEECKYQLIPVMYTKFEVESDGTGINLELTLDEPRTNLFMMIMKERMPTVRNYSHYKMVQDMELINGTYKWFLMSNEASGKGTYYIGVGEYQSGLESWEMKFPATSGGDITWLQNVSVDYDIRVYTTGCYYFSNISKAWVSHGLQTVASSYEEARCHTRHMTSFSSGLFVMPNTIDFSYVFANMGFTDNLTIYVTLIICLSLFVILMIWARWQDRKDIQQLGAAPLPDNQANHRYLYEILVFTGNKKGAQTDSNVQFVLFGENGSTDIRTFSDDRRKIFRKAGADVFVMAVEKPLGPLSYIRIWHDNSGVGINASWFLSYIVFRDVQTGRKFEFICNEWFGVDSRDGQIERALGVAGIEDKTAFSHLFHNTSNKNLVDGHLWFSVFLRPARSRFTRCQRVACCFFLLFLSMLVNAMWYDTVPSQTSTGGISFGPFSLSPEQIGVGVMSNLIVFPPSFLVVFLFRRSRPRVLRKSRIQEALERASKKTKNQGDDNSDSADEESESKKTDDSQPQTETNSNQDKTSKQEDEKKKKKKKKFTLPWFFQLVAWALVVIGIAVSVFFLLTYGIMFGNEKATKWVTALIISFFSSVLFVQPIKVFLMAMLMSIIFKSVDLDEDDADEDEESPELQKDELWLYDGERSQKLGYSQLDKELLEEMKKRRLKEIQMWNIILELTAYSIFIWVLLILSYGQRDPNAWFLQNNLRNSFIHEGALDGTDFTLVTNTELLWKYLHLGLLSDLRADVSYNGKPPYTLRGYLNDYANRIMGYGTIRQIRAKKNICPIPKATENITSHCAGFTNIINEDHTHYCKGWHRPTNKTYNTESCNHPEFRYSSASELKSLPIWGKSDWYGGGGYVIHLQGPSARILKTFTFLQENQWIDKMTRSVFIEFSVYNTQVNLFGICTIIAEFTPGGGIRPHFRFEAIRLIQHHDNFGAFIIACEIIFILFTIYFTIHEMRLLCKQKSRYFDSYWSYAEIALILVSYSAIIVYIVRYFETQKVLDIFDKTYGNGYMKMTYAASMDEIFGYMIAFLTFVGTLKFIKLLRFNKRMGILSATIHQCWDDLSGFLMAFLICFASFVLMFYLLLNKEIEGFSTLVIALETSFSMMMGKFQFNEMKEANFLAPVMFFVFVLCTSWVLVNLLLTLIIKSFEQVKNDIMKQPNEYEMVEFILMQLKSFIGIKGIASTLPRPQPAQQNAPGVERNVNVEELPNKVDKFLDHINLVYFGGKLDNGSKDFLKSATMMPERRILNSDSSVGVNYRLASYMQGSERPKTPPSPGGRKGN